MGLLKKKLKVDSIHISTPLFSVGLRADNTQEIPTSHCRYDVVLGNILEIQGISGLVIPTNQNLKPGAGSLDGYAYKAAGEGLWKELKTLGSCKPGTAEVTGAYELPYKYLIHVVGKAWDGNNVQNEDSLKQSYICALEKAIEYKIRTVAFPSIGTGNNGYPLTKAAGIAVNTVEGFVNSHPDSFDRIVWGLNSQDTYDVYSILLK